jgi:hypothetical protein
VLEDPRLRDSSDLALAISKLQLQCELHDPRITAGRGDHAERRARREIVYGLTEFRGIREVEEFRAEIEIRSAH